MNIVLFGGSFDPPHADHYRLLEWLVLKCPVNFDEIWLMPTVNHAFGKEMAPYEDRERLVSQLADKVAPRSAFNNGPGKLRQKIKVVRRDEKYTVETLEALRVEQPDDIFYLVVGGDVLNDIDKWHRWDDVVKLATLIPVIREGEVIPEGYEPADIKSRGFSSTQIRSQLAEGDLTHIVNGMLIKETFDDIKSKGLYGYKDEPLPDLEKKLMWVADVKLSDITSKFAPGDLWAITGLFSKVIRVDARDDDDDPGIRILVVHDTGKESDHRQHLRHWRDEVTRRWMRSLDGEELKGVDPAKPKPMSPNMFYLLVGEPVEALPDE